MYTLAIGGAAAGEIIGRDGAYEGDSLRRDRLELTSMDDIMKNSMSSSASYCGKSSYYTLRKITFNEGKNGPERTWHFWVDSEIARTGLTIDILEHLFSNYRSIK